MNFYYLFFWNVLLAGVSVSSTVWATEEDISKCASSAVGGFKTWSDLTCKQRAKVLLRWKQTCLQITVDTLSHLAHRVVPPPLAVWLVSLGNTVSVGLSSASCARPPAPRPPWSDCCSTTAAGLSSGMSSCPIGCHRVRLLGSSVLFLYCI